MHHMKPGAPSPTLPRSHWCVSAIVQFWVNTWSCPSSSFSHCMAVSEHLWELYEGTSDFTVQIVTAINNSFRTTQLRKAVLRNTGFDWRLPHLYPQSGKRDFTAYSHWSNRLNHLIISDSHTFEKLFDSFIIIKIAWSCFRKFLQGFIANMSGKLLELYYIQNKMFNSNWEF